MHGRLCKCFYFFKAVDIVDRIYTSIIESFFQKKRKKKKMILSKRLGIAVFNNIRRWKKMSHVTWHGRSLPSDCIHVSSSSNRTTLPVKHLVRSFRHGRSTLLTIYFLGLVTIPITPRKGIHFWLLSILWNAQEKCPFPLSGW